MADEAGDETADATGDQTGDRTGDRTGDQTGVPNERTALAWQRTALSLLAGAAIISRLTFERIGPVAWAALGVVLPLSAWVLVESRGRYVNDVGPRVRGRPRGGRAPAAVAVATVTLAAVELLAIAR
jgi:uncharacterized membrane protein YidH (DUF202 family)